MSKPRLLVIDIDGTLLNQRGEISPEDRQALERVREQGVPISLSTGRALRASTGVLEKLALDSYHVFFDGALVSKPDLSHQIYTRHIEAGTVREMVRYSRGKGLDLELYSSTGYFAERETWSTRAHSHFFNMEFTPVNFDGIWEREFIVKAGLTVANGGDGVGVERFARHFADSVNVSQARTPAYPGVVFNNILAPEVSKGRAVAALAEYLGIPLEEVMAVGDGSNDIPLLSAVGLAVAMGNASPELKAVADYVTLDVEQSGLAEAVKKFLLQV